MARIGIAVLAMVSWLAGIAGPAAGDTPELLRWQLVRDEDGIRSYQSTVEGSPLLAFKGEAVLDAPIDRVISVVTDAPRAGEWVPMMSESVVLRWIEEPVEYVQFTRFAAPWPVSDRVFVSRVTLRIDPETRRARVDYHRLRHPLDEPDAIQGDAAGSYYVMTPIDEGRRTHFIGVSVADPKGALPIWLVNWMGGSWAHDALQSLRSQLRREDVRVLPQMAMLLAPP